MTTDRLDVQSPVFDQGERIPRRYTGEGPDVSPPIEWSRVPRSAQEIAIICDDPDAPTPKPWVHWVLYGLRPQRTRIDEGGTGEGVEGANDFSRVGYGGPMPPKGHGLHHYHFKVYALDQKLGLKPGATKDELLEAMEGHIVAQGELMGTYERN